MKPSKYNLIFEHKGKKLAFNSYTCALAEVNEDFLKILDSCQKSKDLEGDEELINNMKSGNYIVDDDLDETLALKLLNYSGKFKNQGLNLVIAPTLSCNFACPYCFESPTKGVMLPDVQQSVIQLVESAAKSKSNISITWYGGEPLVAKDIVFSMSEKFIDICRKYGVNYNASIVTNGYLIDDSIVDDMVKCRIFSAQITIDGPEDVHNQRRKLKVDNGQGTFKKIIENIKRLISKSIDVSIRINIDKTNATRAEELLDVLKSNGLDKCRINLGHVRPYTTACSSIMPDCFDTQEYANINTKYQAILNSKGFDSSSYPYYPGTKSNYCCADSISSFVIDPLGNMYKCWNDVGNISRKVGNITDENNGLEANPLHIRYMLWSPFDYDECKNCNILPICMGGCPYEGQKQGKPDCEKWKYNLLDTLKFTYERQCTCNKN